MQTAVVVPCRKGYEFAARRGELFHPPYTEETGSHRLEGILIAAGPDITESLAAAETDIQDLAPSLLYLQDCPIPNYMDGRVIVDIMRPELPGERQPQFEERSITLRDDLPADWDEAAEAEISERLRKLGYLG